MSIVLDPTIGITNVNGTAAAPALTGADTNTGIFYPAADTIAFAEGGTESMRLDSNGNVGIGTTAPTTKLTISNNTALPSAGAITSTGLWNVGQNSAQSVISIDAFGNLAAIYGRNASGTAASPTATTSDTSLLLMGGRGYGTTGYSTGSRSWIRFNAAETWTDTAQGTYILFSTTPTGSTTIAERMRIDSSGNVFVGKTSTGFSTNGIELRADNELWVTRDSSIPVSLNRKTSTGELTRFHYNGTKVGDISTNGTGTTYNSSSDYRLKENIQPMIGALDKVAQLKPVTYTWKADGSNGQGFIAHELQEVVPDCVTGEKDAVNEDGSINPQGIDTSKLVATLTAAIQEQQTIINNLKARIETLEAKK